MDMPAYLTGQRTKLTNEFNALKTANDQARQQIASLDSSIKLRNEQMCQLQGAFAQLRHLEAQITTPPTAEGTDAPLLAATPKPRRRRTTTSAGVTEEQAHG